MRPGKLYCIGVGPGNSELLTVKGARIIAECSDAFVPTARKGVPSVALKIAQPYLTPSSRIHEMLFPMETDRAVLASHWDAAAGQIAAVLRSGKNACFLTLGDPLIYSTSIYLVRSLKLLLPDVEIEIVPGIPAMCAVAALTQFPLGEAKQPIVIVPTSDDFTMIRKAIDTGGTVVLMKVGARLQEILRFLDRLGIIEQCVFVAHAGMENQQIETDLRKLYGATDTAGYLSTILIDAGNAV